MIESQALNDKRLSRKAKGIIADFLSKPKDWKIILADLVKHARYEHNVGENLESSARDLNLRRERRVAGNGGRARLRKAKSALSKHRFSIRKTVDLREENALFHVESRVHE